MYSDTAIKVEGLSKCFQIYDTPRDRLKQFVLPRIRHAFGLKPKNFHREFWALRGVSFEIKRGETVGIVGRNGSGKSTLLQLICGTLSPTKGAIKANGRIAALLELGSGFNPEFTGRENVYLNGAILGLTTAEIDARFDEILAFADIGDFIDQPVKTFSSGMMVRLAFSVAINVDPQILIVDEALSVGDELFQRKCFSRIAAIRAAGATILFVSHSGGTVVELCDRAILLDAGEQLAIGIPKAIVGQYQKLIYAPVPAREEVRLAILRGIDPLVTTSQALVENQPKASSHFTIDSLRESFDPSLVPTTTISYESHGTRIINPAIYCLDGTKANNLISGKRYRYSYEVIFDLAATNVRFGMMIKTLTGMELGGSASASSSFRGIPFIPANCVYFVDFEFTCNLSAGVYFLNAGLMGTVNGNEVYLHRLIDVAMFRVLVESETLMTGIVDFNCTHSLKQDSGHDK